MKGLKIVIAGGSGFIGQAMAARWVKENEVIILSRQRAGAENNSYSGNQLHEGIRYVAWDGRMPGGWMKEIDGADLLINLAGRSVNCRYDATNKAEIVNRRVEATKILGKAVIQCEHPPKLWINGGSATIYRHAEDRPQDEWNGEMHHDFSVQVCRAWEKAFNDIILPGTRKAVLRMAIVLGEDGALVPYTRLTRLGLGGQQGNGRQMFSWIHIEDLCRVVEWLWQHEDQDGVYNAAAPGPVPNHTLMSTIRECLKVPFGLPAPTWLLKAGAVLIGTETELLLKSRWVLPARLLKEGFRFQYPGLKEALADLLGKKT